jgi:hypothetical protein
MDGNRGLEELYTRILDERFEEESSAGLERLKLVLGHIICVKEPLSLRALSELTPRESPTPNSATRLRDLQYIVRHLASLLINAHNVDKPIFPFHTSFIDFLCDVQRHHHKYFIDVNKIKKRLAIGCAEVMERELRFNICQIPTSYKANKDVENLGALAQKNISRHLVYASHFWAQHFSELVDVDDMVSSKLLGLLSTRFLEWLEVMSVTDVPFQVPLAAIKSSKVSLHQIIR